MAKVEIVEYREQYAHFGFYKQGAGGDEILLIRRKVGDPTDYMHSHSKAVQRQREIFSQASIHYSHLTPTQKAEWRRQIRWVSRIKPGSQSEEVILKGRQLFISEDIHELATKQKQLVDILEICIMLVDEDLIPLTGNLWLYCTVAGEWFDLPREEIGEGSWLFRKVPPNYPPYRVYGEVEGYYDPKFAEHQAMTIKEIKAYPYHILIPEDWHIRRGGSTYFRTQGWSWLQPFNASKIQIRTLIHWGDLAGEVRTNLQVPWPDGTILKTEDYYIHSVECQYTEHITVWTGLNLQAGNYYYYNIRRPGPVYHLWKYNLWFWFTP